MTRLGRRASLLVVFLLLTSAAPAHAECTWVLWGAVSPPNAPGHFSRHAAYESRDQCFHAAKSRVGNGRDTRVLKHENGWTEAFKTGTVSEYQCWPDTVDPRGAKGK